MDLEAQYSIIPAPAHPADKPVGVALMVISAVFIPILMIIGLGATVFVGMATAFHIVSGSPGLAHAEGSGGMLLMRMFFSIFALAGMVYAGFGISRSTRQGFVIALVIGIVAIVLRSAMIIGIGATVYSALRLFGGLGPKPK